MMKTKDNNRIIRLLLTLALLLTCTVLLTPGTSLAVIDYGPPDTSPTSPYLTCAQTECEQTPELLALAAELENDPVKIYNWVYNNIEFEDYYFSRKNAHTTYLTRRGNEWDQSSLLITLLRIAQVPSRYIIRDTTANTYDPVNYVSQNVYVEAWLPAANYRGQEAGVEDSAWLPLVPWLKSITVKEGLDLFPDGVIPPELDFDFNAYLSTIQQTTALEQFEAKLQEYLTANHPGMSLKDIPYKETIVQTHDSILPAAFPIDLSLSSGIPDAYSSIPDIYRMRVSLFIKKKVNDSLLLSKEVFLSAISGKSFHLDFTPEGSTEVRPVLKINGIDESIGLPIGNNEEYYLAYSGGGYTYMKRPPLLAGTFQHISFDHLASSERTIEALKMELEGLRTDTILANETETEDFLRLTGQLLGTSFQIRRRQAVNRAGELLYGKMSWKIWTSPLFLNTDPTSLLADTDAKFLIHPQWNIDTMITAPDFYKANDFQKTVFPWSDPFFSFYRSLYMYSDSYNESLIFEDWQNTPGLSTVKGFMVANESDPPIPIVEVNASDMITRKSFAWIRFEGNCLNVSFSMEGYIDGSLSGQKNGGTYGWLPSGLYWTCDETDPDNKCLEGEYDNIVLMASIGNPEDCTASFGQFLDTEHLSALEDIQNPIPNYYLQSIKDELSPSNDPNQTAVIKVPVNLVAYEGLIGFVYLTNAENYDGYMFNLINGGTAAEYVFEYDYFGSAADEIINDTFGINPDLLISPIWEEDYTLVYDSLEVPLWQELVYNNVLTTNALDITADVNSLGDPVDMVTGEFYQEELSDIVIKGRGFDLSLSRKYRSRLIYNGPFGFGWSWNHGEHLVKAAEGEFIYYDKDSKGFSIIFDDVAGEYQYAPGTTFTFTETPGPSYTITLKDDTKLHFDSSGLLVQKEDSSGNTLNFTYGENGALPDSITTITDDLGRTLTLTYGENGAPGDKVTTVADFTGRTMTYQYNGDDLVTFTDLEGNVTSYEYLVNQEVTFNNHNMTKYTLPNGDFLEIGYYLDDTVAYHRNKKGEVFNFQYSRINQYGEVWNEEGYYRKLFFNDVGDVIRVATEEGTIEQMTYDADHNMLSKTDTNGNLYEYTYDANRNITSKQLNGAELWTYEYNSPYTKQLPSKVTDPENNVVEFEYWPNGKLYKKIEAPGWKLDPVTGLLVANSGAPGFITTYEYDANGNLKRIIDPLGKEEIYTYDTNSLHLVSKTDRNNNVTTYEFYQDDPVSNPENMPVGLLQSVTVVDSTDPAAAGGYTTTLEYNQYNQKTKVIDALNNPTEYLYDKNRKPTQTIMPNGAVVENIYDTARDIVSGAKIVQTIDPLGNSEHYEYDKVGNLIRKTDRNGNVYTYAYDGMNRLIEETDPFNNTIFSEYDGNGNLVKKTDRRGFTQTFTYDAANRLTDKYDAKNVLVLHLDYYPDGKLMQETDGNGNVTYYVYDALNRLTTKTTGYGTADARVFEYRYDELHRLIKEILPRGNYTTYVYDNVGNKRFVYTYGPDDTLLRKVEYQYYPDSRNLVSKIIIDDGKNSSLAGQEFEYDALGRKTAETDAVGNRVEYVYDAVGNVIEMITPTGTSLKYYDLAGNLTRKVDALGYAADYMYDNNGNLIWQRDNEGNETNFYYDALNKKIGELDALGNYTTLDYDANDNLIYITDANGNSTSYAYDENSRRVSEKRPMGQERTYNYDPAGNLLTAVDVKGNVIEYTAYNSLNQPERVEYFAPADLQNPVKAVDFLYDDNGNLASYDDGVTSAAYIYDYLGRKTNTSVTYPGNITKDFSYDYTNAWEKSFTGPDNAQILYEYDGAHRLSLISVPGESPITYTDYDWNRPGRVTLPGGSTINYTYDPLQRVQHIGAADMWQNMILSRNIEYSTIGNIEMIYTEHGDYSYSYDELSQLVMAVTPVLPDETFTYDAVGNRLTKAGQVGSLIYNYNNELTDHDNTSQVLQQAAYDANGSTIEKYDNGSLVQQYVYDVENRLELVQDDVGTVVAAYHYDPFGRRLWKDVAGVRTYYLYAEEGLIAEFDAGGTITRTYGYVLGSSWTTAPVFQKTGGQYYWYLNDHLGTPQKMINNSGAEVWSAVYDSFGSADVELEIVENNLRFPGQYYDEESGLHYNWNRYYDPGTGRYLRTDPLGLSAGINLYAYVNNNPLGWIDPRGLLLVAIDGTDSANWTKDLPTRSLVRNFYDDYTLSPDESKAYWHGPSMKYTGWDSPAIHNGVVQYVEEQLEINPNQDINIVGFSRGGYIAMEVARDLQDSGVQVNFLGLYDPVDSTLFYGEAETVPSNVIYAANAMSDPDVGSRPYFNTADHGAEDDTLTNYYQALFGASHSGMGGAPWNGDRPYGLTESDDISESNRADQFVREVATEAGINLGGSLGANLINDRIQNKY